MPLTRIVLVSLCLVLFGSLFPTPGKAQELYETDYVVMFDTSSSMNRPSTDPILSKVKTAVREMIENDWLPHSLKQTTPSKLYFYPFAKEVGKKRSYDITAQGSKEFDDYVETLSADGSNTGIVGTLEHVLEEVPKITFQDGRIVRRRYILLTDGEETVNATALVNQDALYKLLLKWGKGLGVTKYGDSCFILRVGKPNQNSTVWKAIENQVERAKAIKDVPVEIGWTLPDPEAMRKKLKPASCSIAPAVPNISIATAGKQEQRTCAFNISIRGSHLPAKIPDGIVIKAEWVDEPDFTSLNIAESAVTAQEWQSLVAGQSVPKVFSINFAPPPGTDVADVGQLIASWVDPAGKLTKMSSLMTVSVTSKGKVEVAVSANKIRIVADRIDLRESTHDHSLRLDADPAVLQNAGKVLIHTEGSWPNDDPILLIDGRPLAGGQAVDLTKNQHKISIQLNEKKGFTKYGGVLILQSLDCQLKSGNANPCTTLRIPWILEGKPIPPALVTLGGELKINIVNEMLRPRKKLGDEVKGTFAISFLRVGAAGEQAVKDSFSITVEDRRVEIDPENKGNKKARIEGTIVKFSSDDNETGTFWKPHGITLEIIIPGTAPAGEYHGVVELKVENAKFTVPGLGDPQKEVDLFWVVIVEDPVPPTVTIESPKKNRAIKVGKEPPPANTPFQLPVEVVFNNAQVNANAKVLVTIAPARFGTQAQWILTAQNPKDILDLVVPDNTAAGRHNISVVFTTQGIDLAAGGNRATRIVQLTVLPAPVATVTLKAPQGNPAAAGTPWNPNQNIASIPIRLDFNAEAKRRNLRVTVTGGLDELVFSPDNPAGVVKVEIPRGQIEKAALIRLETDKNAQFTANGNNLRSFTINAHIVDMPQPQATLHRTVEQESTVFEHAERGDEVTYSIPVSWSPSARWMGSIIRVKKPANVDLKGRDPHVTIEPDGGMISSETTEIVVLTRLSESAEHGNFNETWQFIGEGNLLVEPNEIVFTQRLLSPPMPMWKKLAYAAAATVVLLLVGLLVNQQVKKRHGPPTFPAAFSCEWETSVDGDSGYIKATGNEEHTFGSGTDELETLPISVTLKATKQQYGCGLVLHWEVTEQGADGKITCVKFDDMNSENEFNSGENVSSTDRIVFENTGVKFLELSFHGISESADQDKEFDDDNIDSEEDFDFDDEE